MSTKAWIIAGVAAGLAVLAVLAALVVSMYKGGGGYHAPSPKSPYGASSPSETPQVVGTNEDKPTVPAKVQVLKAELSDHNLSPGEEPQGPLAADSTWAFVTVKITSNYTYAVFANADKLYDTRGRAFEQSQAFGTYTDSFNPGLTITHTFVYDVPRDTVPSMIDVTFYPKSGGVFQPLGTLNVKTS